MRVLRCVLAGVVLTVGMLGCSGAHRTNEVSAHEATWTRAGITSYRFTYYESGMAGVLTYDVTVVDGQPTGTTPEQVPSTMEAVFQQLDDETRQAASVSATYDGSLGYPTAVNVDEKKNVMDDEWGFGVQTFTRL